jgi:hypothetical protein
MCELSSARSRRFRVRVTTYCRADHQPLRGTRTSDRRSYRQTLRSQTPAASVAPATDQPWAVRVHAGRRATSDQDGSDHANVCLRTSHATICQMRRGSHLGRIARVLKADDGLFPRLAALQSADVRAVLLDLAARRAASLRPADILRRYEAGATLQPSSIDPASYRRFESWAMDQLPEGFEELMLAPHAPLGTSSVLGGFSQDRVMTTIADSEVISDSTNVLALECAHRRHDPTARRQQSPIRLAASHRMLRPRESAHFGLLALCTAGRDRGSFALEVYALHEQLDWHLRVITGHAPHLELEVLLTDLSSGQRESVLDGDLLGPMHTAWPTIDWGFDDDRQAGRGYYIDACFAINAVLTDGSRANLSDGGLTNWTARLLADRKERLLISGLGSDRLVGVAAAAFAAPHTWPERS